MTRSSADPASGAITGARPEMSESRDSILTSGYPPNRSRTVAVATTPPAAAPAPCSTRNTISSSTFGLSAIATLASTCTEVAMISGIRLPTRSLHGPTRTWPIAKPMVVALSVICTAAVVAERSA